MATIEKRADLNCKGWVKLDPPDLVGSITYKAAAAELPGIFQDLPPDPYCTSNTRLRRFRQFELDPVSQALNALTPERDPETAESYVVYFQNKQVNPDDGGHGRRFPALDFQPRIEATLKEIIWNCYDLIDWGDNYRNVCKAVGLHAVSYQPRGALEAVASPNVFHQDGEPYTFCILVERHAAGGGQNYVGTVSAANKRLDEVQTSDILDVFTLHNTFEGFGVCDRMVTHHVAPLTSRSEKEQGFRNVLLIDFSPIS